MRTRLAIGASVLSHFHLDAPWIVLTLAIGMGLILAALPLAWASAGLLLVLLLVALLRRPAWGLYFIVFAVPFGSILEFPLGVLSIGLAELTLVATAAAWIGRMLARKEFYLPRAPLVVPLLLFLGAISLSAVGSTSLSYSLKGVLIWLEVLVVYLLVADQIRTGEVNQLVLAVFLAGSLQALLGIYQFLRGQGPESFLVLGRFIRAYGSFEQPNPFGGYMGLIIPLATAVALAPGPTHRGMLFRGVAALALGLTGAALIMSWSRGAWMGAAAAIVASLGLGAWALAFDRRWAGLLAGALTGSLALFWWASAGEPALGLLIGALAALGGGVLLAAGRGGRRAIILWSFLIVLAAILSAGGAFDVIPAPLVERLIDFFPYLQVGDVRYAVLSDENFAVLERLALWQAAWSMWGSSPWLGVGIGNYVPLYPRFKVAGWDDPLGHAHNYYLQVAAETGLLGTLAYIALWGVIFWQALRLLARGPMAWRAVIAGILGSLVALSVHSLVDYLYVHAMNMHIGIYLGLLAVIHSATSNQGARSEAPE
ncbi:MAG: O-antigen ligase family protein [Chloroflexi bacterium]|nr:O-antigen ligase family protein [Chloroflexota bacterium]